MSSRKAKSAPAAPVASATRAASRQPVTRRQFVEAGGNFCRSVGLPRSVGQIYGLLYLSIRPLSLQDICEQLGISKGSASLGTRQLLAWGAIRHVWVPGSRRDHFVAVAELGDIVRRVYHEFFKRRFEAADGRLGQLLRSLDEDRQAGLVDQEEFEEIRTRLERLQRMRQKVKMILPLVDRFL